jgi:hypothetical protein
MCSDYEFHDVATSALHNGEYAHEISVAECIASGDVPFSADDMNMKAGL